MPIAHLSSSARSQPTLTSGQVKQADRLASERFGVPVDWLMEAAGWQVARFCGGPTTVVCGTGNNGGDGLAAARHLHRWGRLLRVCCLNPARLDNAPARQLQALRAIGVQVDSDLSTDGSQYVLDALLGTGLSRPPVGQVAEWINAINASNLAIVAVDLPSGLDADTGRAYSPCVRATTTATLGLAKPGLFTADGPSMSGDVWVVDIGMPFEVYSAMGIEVSRDLFAKGERLRL